MIFQHTWQHVLSGKKTQTRRLAKDDEYFIRSVSKRLNNSVAMDTGRGGKFNMPPFNYRVKWKVGHTYAVQPGGGKEAVGRIRITDIRRERLRNISEEDARAEGARIPMIVTMDLSVALDYRAGFVMLWNRVHTEPEMRWEDNPEVWVLEFEVV